MPHAHRDNAATLILKPQKSEALKSNQLKENVQD